VHNEGGHIVETPVEARAGFLDRPTLVVLIVSTSLTVGLFATLRGKSARTLVRFCSWQRAQQSTPESHRRTTMNIFYIIGVVVVIVVVAGFLGLHV
jgi:hypothetical protein